MYFHLVQCFIVLYSLILHSAANNLQRLDGFGGDDIDKLAINDIFEVPPTLYWSKSCCCCVGSSDLMCLLYIGHIKRK